MDAVPDLRAMEGVIAQLVELQQIDRELRDVRQRLEAIPRTIANREIAASTAKAAFDQLKAEAAKLQADTDATDLEIHSGEEILRKYRKQLGICKSAKEIAAVRNYMKTQQAWIDQYVEKGMALMQQSEQKKAELAKAQSEAEGADAELKTLRANSSAEAGELRKREEDLSGKRGQMGSQIPRDELAVYEGAIQSRGDALARVESGACSACHMRLPPQIHNLVLLKKKLVTCTSCGRILVA